ncbi:dihydrodipicolinate reductase [Thalassobacter stenotrophicus]|uniref:hypothetical protein n=1 Tax=Thalassobacter TaxID=266808 RepID=UPI00051D85FC|nr:hypothetical protein [Thalassobacter stenotrophicus]KGK78559.1 dihydrodipicolinate reductase [Thalassobacter stenotrophicus]KGL00709.1 dihydrodipicolinate reductase [Thalassobacter sp. 16PALIMAR09]
MVKRWTALAAFGAVMLMLPVTAHAFEKIDSRTDFVSLIDGKALTRFGIKLDVTGQGGILGRGFGRDVTGAWQWQGNYFCRSLYWGTYDLGYNCQEVRVNGDTLRFTSDQGAGDSADLKLR